MCRGKALLIAAIVLATVSIVNAQSSLTIDGLDTTKPLEIKGKDNLIIAVTWQSDTKAQDISVTCDTGKVELLKEPGKYLFTFAAESDVSTISLDVYNEIIYQLILFYIPETDTAIAFGVGKEALKASQLQPEPNPQPQLEQQISASQPTSSEKSFFVSMSDVGTTEINSFPEPNAYPDFNSDKIVNFADFAVFANNWQKSGGDLDGDFDNSGTVDTNDLATFAYFWLNGPHPLDVFDSFKMALSTSDVNEAVSYFAEVSAENYRLLLEQLSPYFTQMLNDMGEMVFIRFDTDMVVYDLLREENGDTYGYPVVFIKDEMGQWKIYDF